MLLQALSDDVPSLEKAWVAAALSDFFKFNSRGESGGSSLNGKGVKCTKTSTAGDFSKIPAMIAPRQAQNTLKRCFAPVIDARCRVLILGSLPGDKSLAAQEYYGNPQNRFWSLMSEVIGVDLVSLNYRARLETLLEHGVGLWDVVAEAHRSGSLDSKIRNRDDNDLVGLLSRFPNVRVLAFNGGTAARLGIRKLGVHASGHHIVRLPSSSPAYTLRYAEKSSQWKTLMASLAIDA